MKFQGAVDMVVNALAMEESQMDVGKGYKGSVYQNAARILGEEALRRGSYDNVTVLVVWLK